MSLCCWDSRNADRQRLLSLGSCLLSLNLVISMYCFLLFDLFGGSVMVQNITFLQDFSARKWIKYCEIL